MNIGLELLVVIIINVATCGVFIGGLAMAVKFIEKQIERLEEKQDKHNSVIERTYACEQSLKAEHHRLDSLEDQYNKLHDKVYEGKKF